jgi:hypothetical protein
MRVLALAAVALAASGCADAGAFMCVEAAECEAARAGGSCEANGYCSFPDAECPSGRRYGAHAPGGIAGSCVPEDVAEGTSAADPTGIDGDSIDPTDADEVGPHGDTTTSATTQGLDDSSEAGASSNVSTGLDDDAVSSEGSGISTTGTPPFDVEYVADIAVCTQDTVFDPDACAVQAGVDQFTVDLSDTDALIATGWVRFVLDDTLAGAEVTSAEVVFIVGPDASDGSGSTGELWTTEPFDLTDLSSAAPATLELVGDDLGVARLGAEVIWPVPLDLVIAGEPLYLAIVPLATDGIDLWDASSANPPRLVITAQ